MYFFKLFVESFQAGRMIKVVIPKDHSRLDYLKPTQHDLDTLQKSILEANLFVFETSDDRTFNELNQLDAKKVDTMSLSTVAQEKLSHALPFQVCFFESYNSEKNRPVEIFQKYEEPSGEVTEVHILGHLVRETAPNTYIQYILMMDPKSTLPIISIFDENSLDVGGVNKLLERLNSMQLGSDPVREKIKIGKKGARDYIRIHRIVRVCPKSDIQHTRSLSGGEINWSHRWLVRGHWRKTEGLGKDRTGDYCIPGHTWVTEHEKGPEELPLIQKTRVVELNSSTSHS